MKGNLEVCIEDGTMKKGVSTQRHAWIRSNRDLIVCDLTLAQPLKCFSHNRIHNIQYIIDCVNT